MAISDINLTFLFRKYHYQQEVNQTVASLILQMIVDLRTLC
jgi:hypothetical protein